MFPTVGERIVIIKINPAAETGVGTSRIRNVDNDARGRLSPEKISPKGDPILIVATGQIVTCCRGVSLGRRLHVRQGPQFEARQQGTARRCKKRVIPEILGRGGNDVGHVVFHLPIPTEPGGGGGIHVREAESGPGDSI